jgi:hypothetical protein
MRHVATEPTLPRPLFSNALAVVYTGVQTVSEERVMAKPRTIPSLADLSWLEELSLAQLTTY